MRACPSAVTAAAASLVFLLVWLTLRSCDPPVRQAGADAPEDNWPLSLLVSGGGSEMGPEDPFAALAVGLPEQALRIGPRCDDARLRARGADRERRRAREHDRAQTAIHGPPPRKERSQAIMMSPQNAVTPAKTMVKVRDPKAGTSMKVVTRVPSTLPTVEEP